MKTFLCGSAVLLLLIAASVQVDSLSSSMICPTTSQDNSCSPKCLQDTDCSSMGGRCCPNICNYKSCMYPKNSANNNKYGTSGQGTGNYCGNLKCNAYEKCITDQTTRRLKCVRA